MRAFHPDAVAGEVVPQKGKPRALAPTGRPGIFETTFKTSDGDAPRYRLRFHFADGSSEERDDPYRFPESLGDVDLYLFAEGTHRRLWQVLGAVPMELEGVRGVRFAVWLSRLSGEGATSTAKATSTARVSSGMRARRWPSSSAKLRGGSTPCRSWVVADRGRKTPSSTRLRTSSSMNSGLPPVASWST